jgi:hypothetical protein
MRGRAVLAALLILLAVIAVLPHSGQSTTVAQYCARPVDVELLNLINEHRRVNGRAPLQMSQTLGAAAEHHAWDMALTATHSHTMSDGTTWSANIRNHDYSFLNIGENIAWGYTSAQAVFNAWKSSSGHNSAMLTSGFRAIGLSLVEYTLNGHFDTNWVNTFGGTFDQPAVFCGSGVTATTAPTSTPVPTRTPTATSVPTVLPPPATIEPEPTNTPKPCRGNGRRACEVTRHG